MKLVGRGKLHLPRLSPLTKGRGLKRVLTEIKEGLINVAPHEGAWIETSSAGASAAVPTGRPSRRGVD